MTQEKDFAPLQLIDPKNLLQWEKGDRLDGGRSILTQSHSFDRIPYDIRVCARAREEIKVDIRKILDFLCLLC